MYLWDGLPDMAGKLGKKIYASPLWQRVRRLVFKRDGHRCTMCGKRGGLECDHIEPIASAGDWFDMANLRTLCRACHIRVTREEFQSKLPRERRDLLALAVRY